MTSPESVCSWPVAADDTPCRYPKTHIEEESLTNISPVIKFSNPSLSDQSSIPAPPPLPVYITPFKKRCQKKPSSIICRETRDIWDQVFKEGYGADVYVITDNGTPIPAHSSFLRVASTVLGSFLLQSKPRSGKVHLELLGVPHAAVYAFIRFLYSSCCEEEDMKNYALHLLVLSHAFSVPQLKRVCVQFLEHEWLTIENVMDVLQLARNCDAPRLSFKCVRMIVREFKAVSSTDGWKVMRVANPSLEQELLESVVEADSRKQDRLIKEEKNVYMQLNEAMEALVHICKDGCRTIGPFDKVLKANQLACKHPACKGIEMLVRHFSGCKRQVPGGCVQCKRFWQLLELHSRMCNDTESCKVPRCRQLKEKLNHPSKKDEAKWRLLVAKIIEAKSIRSAFMLRQHPGFRLSMPS